jgi:hypothetical protein
MPGLPRVGLALQGRNNPAAALEEIDSRLEALYAKQDAKQDNSRRRHILNARIRKLEALRAKYAMKAGMAYALQGQAGAIAGSGIRGVQAVEQEFGPDVIAAHNAQMAAQGLRYQVDAPPPSGQLAPIPMVVTGLTNPIHNVTAGAAFGLIGASTNLVSETISWAVLKVLALTSQIFATPTSSTVVCQDFKMGGGPNLFLPENWVDASQFDVDNDSFVGLRGQPVLRSPNTMQLTVAARSGTGPAEVTVSSFHTVTTVIRDDAFGPGLPGAGQY